VVGKSGLQPTEERIESLHDERAFTNRDEEVQEAVAKLEDHIANLAAQRAELMGLQRDLDQFKDGEAASP